MAASIRQWWRQPDQYNWLSEYLVSRQLQRFTRVMIASIAAILGLVPIVMLFSPSGPQGELHRSAAIMISVVCVGGACIWVAGWPSQRQSTLFALGGNACVTLACLIAGSPVTGLLACTTFAPLAGYVALFHSSRLLAATLANAALATAIAAARVADDGDIALAAGHVVGVAIAVLAVPFAGQVLLHLLTLDALMSHTDPLTGLRNRRGYYQLAARLVAAADRSESRWLAVIMIDLDGFKQINDRHGHGFGDAVLIAVADNLRRASAMNSVVARLGGEEFLIAELTEPGDPTASAERLRAAVAAAPGGVTASVGMATLDLTDIDERPVATTIAKLADTADAAMYEAKRAGGNQVRYRTAMGNHS
ncbi:GGDEF domain-containing protein [Mycolicibacterium helvum]|nr:GGDEF domain-containing protein [Mycolicibacterium helvum]